ncbi:MAG: PilX N-terminal domain-containing pilus assembly protein [Methylomonas sp.]
MANETNIHRQNGMATLVSVVVVLIILTLMALYAAKVGVFDLRMAANEARYKEAFATAEAGLDLAVERFADQFQNNFTGNWTTIVNNSVIAAGTGLNGAAAGANQPSFGVAINNTGASIGGVTVYEFVSTGISADGTGTARVSRQVTMKAILGGAAPDVPVIVSGSVGSGGDFNIVANPNGGGNGIPVSVWTGRTNSNVTMTGSSATCQMQFYAGNNAACSNPSGNAELISQGSSGLVLTSSSPGNPSYPDILPNDPNFPADLFQFLFGVPRSDWQTVKSMAASNNQVVADCSGLNATSGQKFRLWWVTGDCNMGSNQVIGSEADPVILVIDDHQLNMGGGGAKIYGIPFLFNNPSNAATPSAAFHGSPSIFGAFISDVGGTAMQGSYSIVYDPTLINNASSTSSPANFSLAYIPGSWRDFQ